MTSMKSLFWHKHEFKPSPSSRDGHSFVYSPRLRRWVLFGGKGSNRYNDLWTLNPATKQWQHVEARGTKPCERSGHVCWLDHSGKLMFVHGGKGDFKDSLGDLLALDLQTMEWKSPYVLNQPVPRMHHAGCTLQGCLYLFGGVSEPDGVLLNDFWSFSYSEVDWTAYDIMTPSWRQLRNKGAVPSARKGHTLCAYRDTIVLFGGLTELGCTNQMYVLNVTDMTWIEAKSSGSNPSPRAFHSCTLVTHTHMAIFGGIEDRRPLGDIALLDLNEMLWTVPMVGGFWPSPRLSCGMSWGLSEEGKGLLLIVGGSERNLCRMELFSLEETPIDPARSWHVTKPDAPVRASNAQAQLSITEQGRRLAKLESQLKSYSDTVTELAEQKQQIEEQQEYERELNHEQQRQVHKKLELLEQEIVHKDERLETSHVYYNLLKQKETILSRRVDDLEDLVKKAETLLITLDHAYHEVISSNQNFGFKPLPRDKLLTLEERKKQHSQGLASTRGHYQETIAEQEALDSQLAALKDLT